MNELSSAVDWSTEAIVARRERFYAATQRKFVPYQTPQIFRRGAGQAVRGRTIRGGPNGSLTRRPHDARACELVAAIEDQQGCDAASGENHPR